MNYAFYTSDHHMLIMYFSSQLISNTIANARLKQKRDIILYQNIMMQQWEYYQMKIEHAISSSESITPLDINTKWLRLKKILYTTAIDIFPVIKVSNTH